MPLLNVNLTEVPNEIPVITAGKRTLVISEPLVTAPGKKDPSKSITTVTFKVNEEGNPDHGRMIKDRFDLSNQFGLVKFKKLVRAAGIPISPSGIDTNDFIGKTVVGVVAQTVQTDAQTGQPVTFANVNDYIVG